MVTLKMESRNPMGRVNAETTQKRENPQVSMVNLKYKPVLNDLKSH